MIMIGKRFPSGDAGRGMGALSFRPAASESMPTIGLFEHAAVQVDVSGHPSAASTAASPSDAVPWTVARLMQTEPSRNARTASAAAGSTSAFPQLHGLASRAARRARLHRTGPPSD